MFKVLIHGIEFDYSDDVLIADAMAHCYKNIGWKDVKVKGPDYERVF